MPTIACSGTPGLARARADLADELALERLLVELALAGHHGAGGAHARVEVERVEDERRARAPAARRARPTARRSARRPRRSSARRAGRAGAVRPARRAAPRAAPTIAGSAPFCGPNTAGARSNGVRTSDSTTMRAPPQAAVLLDRLERARAAVGGRRAADAEQHDLRARVDRGADQLAGAVGRGRPRRRARPRPRARGPEAAAISITAVPPSSTSPNWLCDRPAERVVHLGARRSRRRARAAAPPSCPRRRRPPGTGRAASGRRARGRGRSRRRPRRRGTCP